MALDYKRGAAKPTPRRTRPRSCVWWFLFGVIIGSCGVGLYWMTQAPGQVPAPVAALPKAERPTPQQPNFQFEKILRDTVVDTKDSGKPPPPPAPRPEPPPPPEQEGPSPPPTADPAKPDATKKAAAANDETATYVLQIGSFKTAKDADNMKAQLAMLGVSTRVKPVKLKNGETWHRVMTGPLNGKKTMEQTRAKLKKNGKEAVPIKLK
ncbi:MAG TPA: SPOR domain-containing protein [Lamprocystis sp. (in: g-proteobacteria)]|nr:SPOR domain-containing protein [Lamprocystis sp. (in: g-proteobacteria)]